MTRLEAAMAELIAAIRDEVRADVAAVAAVPDRLLSVEEGAEILGVSRTSLYQEIAAGRVRSMKVGRRRLVPSTAIAERMRSATATYGDGVLRLTGRERLP